MLLTLLSIACSCDDAPPPALPQPHDFECRDGFRVPAGGNWRDVSHQDGIACAIAVNQRVSGTYGHVVCWNMHGCQQGVTP